MQVAYPSISLTSNPIQNFKSYFSMFLGLLPAPLVTWTIAASTVAAMFARPRRIPEAVWACLGASLLLALRLVSVTEALGAVTKGYDVYLFLTGMMILAELARREGVFDWLPRIPFRGAPVARQHRFASCRGISQATLRFDLSDRNRGNHGFIERCDRRGTDPGRLCGSKADERESFTLSVRLRFHRERRELRITDFKSG